MWTNKNEDYEGKKRQKPHWWMVNRMMMEFGFWERKNYAKKKFLNQKRKNKQKEKKCKHRLEFIHK